MLRPSLSFFENWTTSSLTAAAIGLSAGCGAIGASVAGYKVTTGALFGAFDGAVQGAIIGLWNQIFNVSNGNAACLAGSAAITATFFGGPAISWQLCKAVGYNVGGYDDALIMQAMILAAASGVVPGIIALTAVASTLCDNVRARPREQEPLVPPPPV